MKIPKKINILGVSYKIIQREQLEDLEGNPSETHLGWANESKREIELCTSDNFIESLKEQTLFHEITHAIMYETGLYHAINEGTSEVFAQCLGNAFHQVFKQLKG